MKESPKVDKENRVVFGVVYSEEEGFGGVFLSAEVLERGLDNYRGNPVLVVHWDYEGKCKSQRPFRVVGKCKKIERRKTEIRGIFEVGDNHVGDMILNDLKAGVAQFGIGVISRKHDLDDLGRKIYRDVDLVLVSLDAVDKSKSKREEGCL